MATDDTASASLPGSGADPSAIPWTDGPDWHVRALNELAGPSRSFDRLVGIEMAIDGALNNLSGAFDAAVALLIRTAEEVLEVGDKDLIPAFKYSWPKARDLLKKPAIGTTPQGAADEIVWRVILDMENAMDGEHDPNPIE